jgi:hypothetical protein
MVAVGFSPYEIAIGGATPKICATGMEECACEGTEGLDELAGIAAVKRSAGEIQKKLLESLVRLRRVTQDRIAGMSSQWAPIAQLSG